ncbi:hypothetical protein [Gilvimarinus polysaccharolyticus]|uniref:hypothetical protein n=1 Tax=Gilvimarinus polysaccharolyticus TaxID=863921 RepID=UPI0006737CA3|nr:hypothetical protein [Gilvimarinus polysaccharolyticus]
MSAELEAEINLNDFYKDARDDVKSLLKSVNSAVIFNASGKDVTLHVYNYIDTVFWVSAQKTKIADGYYGNGAASGTFFKIHPNNKDDEFLVAPGNAYV